MMDIEHVQRSASYHHEELACSDLVVFWVGSMFAVCVFIGCICVLCECCFIGASKQPSIDPLDPLDVFCRGASCLERAM